MAINPPSSSPVLPPPTTTSATTMSLTYYPYPTSNSHRLQIFSAFHLTKHGSSPSSKAPPLPPPAAIALATREIIAVSDTNAAELEKFLAFKEEESGRGSDEERRWRNGALVRRKRRRKRTRDSDPDPDSEKAADPLFLKPESSGKYLTAKQEAEYTFCLQEEARVVGVKKKIEGDDSEWGRAAGMSRGSLDKILCNGREAEDRITRCYRRLVISVASSYLGRGLSLQDLIQEGNLGLIHGAKKFNPARGYKLSTYVYWWIKQAMARAIAKKSRITRLPGGISELVPKICEANAVLSQRLRKPPTCEEITELVHKDSFTIALALQRSREPISLDKPRSEGGGSMTLQDIIPGPDEITPEAMVKKQFMKKDLESLLKRLSERERYVLGLYYGLNGNTPLSFEDIGRNLQLSRERVRQISCAALQKLRDSKMLNDLKVYIA